MFGLLRQFSTILALEASIFLSLKQVIFNDNDSLYWFIIIQYSNNVDRWGRKANQLDSYQLEESFRRCEAEAWTVGELEDFYWWGYINTYATSSSKKESI